MVVVIADGFQRMGSEFAGSCAEHLPLFMWIPVAGLTWQLLPVLFYENKSQSTQIKDVHFIYYSLHYPQISSVDANINPLHLVI